MKKSLGRSKSKILNKTTNLRLNKPSLGKSRLNQDSLSKSTKSKPSPLKSSAIYLLDKFGLKKTSLRANIIQLLDKSKKPLSQADIINQLSKKETIDRLKCLSN